MAPDASTPAPRPPNHLSVRRIAWAMAIVTALENGPSLAAAEGARLSFLTG